MLNSHINCNVNQCKFNDQARHCTLDNIVVGCSSAQPHNCCDTECDSFEESMR